MPLSEQQSQYVAEALAIIPAAVRTFRKRHPAWRACLGRLDVESICHLAICKAATTYNPARSQVTTYFSMAMRNALVKAVQKEYRYVQAGRAPTQEAIEARAAEARLTERLQGSVQEALSKLPPRSKFLLHLKFARKMSLRQLAEHSGRDARTIQNWLNEAMDQMETLLRSEFGPP